MKIPREARRLAREFFGLTMHEGHLDVEKVSKVADTIIAEKPRHHLLILKDFVRLVRLELEKHHAVVDSAIALDASVQEQIRGDLSKRFGSDTTFEFQVHPALIGGMRVKLGSDVWDGSVRSRIDTLR